MIKTVKVKKKLRLDELIKYVWDNQLYPETFKSNFNDFAHFDKTGKYRLIDQKGINQATKFAVEVEEEITDDTEFKSALVVHHGEELELYENLSIKGFKYRWPNSMQMHAVINGKLQLIWEAE